MAFVAISVGILGFITSGHAGVPAKLYHYGAYEVLMKNIAAKTVPSQDWDRYIMGDKARYGQKGYRRGLYGSSHPSYASYFSDIAVGSGKQQWLMEVELTEVCQSQKPFSLDALYNDPRVIDFISRDLNRTYGSPEEFRDKCYPYYPEFKTRAPRLEFISGTAAENTCEKFVNTLFEELKPKVVLDDAWPGSWYIRDRACIQSIRGTPQDLLPILSHPGFWSKTTLDGEIRESSINENASLFNIFAKMLASEIVLDEKASARLQAAVASSDIRNPRGWNRDQTSDPHWMARVTLRLLQTRQECVRAQKEASFRENLSVLLEELNRTFDFEPAVEALVEKVGC